MELIDSIQMLQVKRFIETADQEEVDSILEFLINMEQDFKVKFKLNGIVRIILF